jgi:hypothetical protein
MSKKVTMKSKQAELLLLSPACVLHGLNQGGDASRRSGIDVMTRGGSTEEKLQKITDIRFGYLRGITCS